MPSSLSDLLFLMFLVCIYIVSVENTTLNRRLHVCGSIVNRFIKFAKRPKAGCSRKSISLTLG